VKPQPLSTRQTERLIGVLEMLSSDYAGERDAAALAATRLVRDAGLRWVDLFQPPAVREQPLRTPPPSRSDWRGLCAWCAGQPDQLTAWENDFIAALPRFPRLSAKQAITLYGIAARLSEAGR
jgi:hypothetical protein